MSTDGIIGQILLSREAGKTNSTGDDFTYLMKRGKIEELQKLVREEKKNDYAMSYPAFMDDMLAKYRKKRNYIPAHTGLSGDYVYKLLRGDKKTNERDYILAISIAIGMNVDETEHALKLNGMAGLDTCDRRNFVICYGIREHLDTYQISENLQEIGLNPIRVSPDMEKSTIRIHKDDMSVKHENSGHVRKTEAKQAVKAGEINWEDDFDEEDPPYTEIDRVVEAKRNTDLDPFDYNYWAIITVEDREGNKFYVEGFYGENVTLLLVLDEENYNLSVRAMHDSDSNQRSFFINHPELRDNFRQIYDDPELCEEYDSTADPLLDVKVLEKYSSLSKASSSEFFPFYMAIEKATDEKCREIMAQLNDSREQGIRMVGGYINGENLFFAELFNEQEPQKLEYLQVKAYGDGRKKFTVSHHSYFMHYQMGGLYEAYFGAPEQEEYFFEADDLSDLNEDGKRYRFLFLWMLTRLEEAFCLKPENTEQPEEIRTLRNKLDQINKECCPLLCQKKTEAAKKRLLEAENIITELESKGQDMLTEHALNLYKLVSCTKTGKEYRETAEQLIGLKEQVLPRMRAGENFDMAAGMIAETILVLVYGTGRNMVAAETARIYGEDAIAMCELIQDKRAETQKTLYHLYVPHSFLIDGEEPERAVELLEKATDICNEFGYDRNPQMMNNVVTMHYNRAWVLWHRLKNDEAMIYYGYALDCAERCLTAVPEEEQAMAYAELEHVGRGILEFYQETGRTAQAERLKKRLEKDGVTL